jgi:hypothetical protein
MKNTQENQCNLAPAAQVQLVLDWHHDMELKGKPVACEFDPTKVEQHYHQLQIGNPLSRSQLSSLSNMIHKWHMHTWMHKNYPSAKGRAPPPTAVEDDDFPFASDDELDL